MSLETTTTTITRLVYTVIQGLAYRSSQDLNTVYTLYSYCITKPV